MAVQDSVGKAIDRAGGAVSVLESRNHVRLAAEIPVRWSVAAQSVSGDGVLLDYNLTGACPRIERPLNWTAKTTFALSSSEVPMLPPSARLRWFRRVGGPGSQFVRMRVVLLSGRREREGLGGLGRSKMTSAARR
jgi:hypothetical protein